MNAHTPGPWKIGNLESYDSYTGQPYRNVWAGQNETATVVARAIRSNGSMTNNVDCDARLISAAPDLLEALKILLDREWQDDEGHPLLEYARNKSRAAIAKATGQ